MILVNADFSEEEMAPMEELSTWEKCTLSIGPIILTSD